MTKRKPSRKAWTVARARQELSALLRSAAHEPQAIYKRRTLVAGVVDAGTFQDLTRWRDLQAGPSLAQAFEVLRAIAAKDGYALPERPRRNRKNQFAR